MNNKVAIVFEPACDLHWMKDVVQFPNALSKHLGNDRSLLIARPNRKQQILEKHIDLCLSGSEEIKNIVYFEKADISKIIYDESWYIEACALAAEKAQVLVIYPWYGNFTKGAKTFKKKSKLKSTKVVLKTDSVLKLQSEKKAGLRQIWRDFFVFRNVDFIICENKSDYEKLLVTNRHLTKKLIFIPNCPLDIYSEQVPVPFKDRKNSFLFVGRGDDEEKGLDILLNAWSEAVEEISGWQLIIAGPISGELKQQWEKAFSEKQISNTIQWIGPVDPDNLIGLYNSVKIVVCPSRKESGPIILSESILSGCAFIGTNVGEIPDYLHSLPGLLENGTALKMSLIEFANNPGMAEDQAKELYSRMKVRNWIKATKELADKL